MLYIIGLGLNDFRYVSQRSLEILLDCDVVYLENYTCVLLNSFSSKKFDGKCCDKFDGKCCNKFDEKCCNKFDEKCCDKFDGKCCDKFDVKCCDKFDEKCCDKFDEKCCGISNNSFFNDLFNSIKSKLVLADRKLVEETYEIIEEAKEKNIAFLVAGTPFFATTHVDLLLRAKEEAVAVKIIPNTSIASVKGCFGLYSYNFGCTISIPYFTETWKPTSFLDRIYFNYKSNMHTLCLQDIKVDEGRFMSVNEAIDYLWEASSIKVAELKQEKALEMKREEETRTNAKEEEETHTNAKE